jgi:flagellar motor switch/type III secretory pathway protein FliN
LTKPYPFDQLRHVRRDDAAIESAVARWLAVDPDVGRRTAKLAGGPVRARVVGRANAVDPHAAIAVVRVGELAITAAASGTAIRALAQQLLGGPTELAAARPATPAEHAIWALVVAAALEDLGIAGADVWAQPIPERLGRSISGDDAVAIELEVDFAGRAMTVACVCPQSIVVRVPPMRPWPGWTFELPVTVARCALSRDAAASIAVRDVIVVERALELVIGDGAIGLHAAPQAVVAEVTSHYSPRDMALPDDAHLELTVALGTTRLSMRQIAELAVGQIVPLGRPLAGPFELRAGGRVIGHGELIDVDGELGVRVTSIEE